MFTATRHVISRSTVRFHCCVYCVRKCTGDDVIFGVSQEISASPNAQGFPGFGFAFTIGWPWKKSPNVRVGASGGRSLNAVEFATNGTVTTVLLMRFVSGNAKKIPYADRITVLRDGLHAAPRRGAYPRWSEGDTEGGNPSSFVK